MDELIYLIIQLIGEAFGAKKRRTQPPGPVRPGAPQAMPPRPAPTASPTTMPPRPSLQTQGAPPSVIPSEFQRVRPRRPDAGGTAVTREATTAEFEAQEAQLIAGEPAPLNSLGKRLVAPASPSTPALFSSSDDIVRAFILSEVFGPPLSRRTPRR